MNTTNWIIAFIATIYVSIFIGICILYRRYRYYIHRQEQLMQEGYFLDNNRLNEVNNGVPIPMRSAIKNIPDINKDKNIIV